MNNENQIIVTGPSECPKCGAELPPPEIRKVPGYEIPDKAYPKHLKD